MRNSETLPTERHESVMRASSCEQASSSFTLLFLKLSCFKISTQNPFQYFKLWRPESY